MAIVRLSIDMDCCFLNIMEPLVGFLKESHPYVSFKLEALADRVQWSEVVLPGLCTFAHFMQLLPEPGNSGHHRAQAFDLTECWFYTRLVGITLTWEGGNRFSL